MRFTKPSVASLTIPEGKSELIVFDDAMPGFGLRLRAGGKRTWIVQYRIGALQRRMTLGSVAVLDLEAARAEARKALAKVGLAVDPQAQKDKARSDAAVTLGHLVARYLSIKKGKLRPRSYYEIDRQLSRDWAPLHRQPLTAINRKAIADRLSALASDHGPVSADRARSALSSFFTWAVRDGLAEANPVAATNRPSAPRARERILSDAELAEIWNACREDDYGRIIRLLMLTGQRREEVGGMLWLEIDLGQATWSLPPDRTKNHRPHDVSLSDAALAVLAALPRRGDREFVFGDGAGGFSGWSRAKASMDRRIHAARVAAGGAKAKQIPPWRLHDLRRTAATRMADLGIGPHVIEAILNHVSGAKAGVAGIYNRSIYTVERRAALTMWAEHLAALVEERPAAVVSLDTHRARHASG